jgi:hypothetical protein
VKIVAFFDWVDYEEDFDHLKFFSPKSWTIVGSHRAEDLPDLIIGADYCFVDYGALSFGGQGGMFDHNERYLDHFIDDHPSVQFVFILTMTSSMYKSEFFDKSNVISISREHLIDFINEIERESV